MSRLFLLALLFTTTSEATVITLGTSTQSVTFTGTGLSQGAGTARVALGSCTYNGTNTTCTLTGQYTGLGNGGTYQIQTVYSGNGASTIVANMNPPSTNAPVFSAVAGTVSLITTITPTGGSPVNFYYTYISGFQFVNATCTGASACNISTVGQTSGATITGQITGQLDLTPRVSSVISASAYGGFSAIAPGSWIEIYGENLATVVQQTWAGSDFNGANAPTALGGTTVTIGGQPAFVDYVGTAQVNVQVPSGITGGTQTVVVTTFGGPSSGTPVTVNPVEPGLLAPAVFQVSAGQYVAALFPNGSTFALPPGLTNAVPTQRPKPGDVITLYGIGFGNVTPNIPAGVIVSQTNSLSGVQFSIGGQSATVQYAGLVSGFLGLYQFNVVVPNLSANDATPITFTLNGSPAQQKLIIPIGN